MTANRLNAILAAVLTTALECQPCPESMIYLALNCHIGDWAMARSILLEAQLITINGNSIALTAKGVDLAKKCNAALVTA